MKKNLTKKQYNFIVKGIIFSDFVYWVSWNFLAPLFSVFVVNEVTDGNLQVVTSSFSFFLIMRLIFVLMSGKYFNKLHEHLRLVGIIIGILLMSGSYIILAFSSSLIAIYLFYGLAGIGMGISDPLKLTIFVKHADKDMECDESGVWQSSALLGSAIASFIGGFIVHIFGFRVLFSLAALINIVAMVPYVLILEHKEGKK